MNDDVERTLFFGAISIVVIFVIYALLLEFVKIIVPFLGYLGTFLIVVAAFAFYELFLGDRVADWKYRLRC